MILVNGISVGFYYHLQKGDYISVYPVFESLDISSIVRLRANTLRQTRFILDVHQLQAKTALYYEEFCYCQSCGKIYWKGSHYEKMKDYLSQLAD